MKAFFEILLAASILVLIIYSAKLWLRMPLMQLRNHVLDPGRARDLKKIVLSLSGKRAEAKTKMELYYELPKQ